MKHSEHNDKLCPLAQTLGIVGDNWTLLILRNAFLGARRFDDFQQQLGLTRHVLTDRLKKLVEHDIFKKVPYGASNSRFEYRLTPKGAALSPVLMALGSWGNQWLFEKEQQPMRYTHKTCGAELQITAYCPCCDVNVSSSDIKMVTGPEIETLKKSLSTQQLTQALGFMPQTP